MCVIIYIPENGFITEDEVRQAWNTNPHGAGFSYIKDEKVHFKRGYMSKEAFINDIRDIVGMYPIVLHFRISTSNAINKIQTHPYKKGNVTITQGVTKRPVICMNGIITGQKEYKDCNDTMSYIIDHNDAFSVINQDILNIIESDTGAKWCVMKPDGVLVSSKFVEYEGRFYSNKNHLITRTYYRTYSKRNFNNFINMIKNPSLRNSIKKDKDLYEDLKDFIDIWCNNESDYMCTICTKCLKKAKTLKDVKTILNENYYYEQAYPVDNDESVNNYNGDNCALDDYYFDDLYYYEDNNGSNYNKNTNIFDE